MLSSGVGSGAELSSGRFLFEAHRRGHVADVVTPEYATNDQLAEYDVLVTKNLTRFSGEQLAGIQRHRFVAWPSDWAWNRWRLYFAFQEQDKVAVVTKSWEAFFGASLFNVFLSPFHRECYEWVMPKLAGHAFIEAPPPVNTDLFRPSPDGWVEKSAVGVNALLDFKALHTSLSWAEEHPDWRVTFVGGTREGVSLPKNAEYLGVKNQSELARIIGRMDTGLELPKTAQPFNRTAVEMLLSCRRVVANGLVGAASYPWFRGADRVEARRACQAGAGLILDRLEREVAA